jgi:hypothetical protein
MIMKRNNIIIFQWAAWLCAILAACSGLEEDLPVAGKANVSGSDTRADLVEYSINVEIAGTLDSLVEAGSYSDAQKLIVTGNIAYTDVKYVDMNMPTVEVLDLAGSEYESESIEGAFLSDSTKIKEISLPRNITTIRGTSGYDKNDLYYSFYPFECDSLISITIPESVTNIGWRAFRGCSSLTSINIPEGVTSIGDEAFYGCSSLISIHIPEGVTSIGDWTFYGCSSLNSINIPKGVTSIGCGAFLDCSSLTSINIPEGVTSIGYGAFGDCSSLTSINIPEGVTSIESGAFSYCRSLTSINIPEGVTSIGYEAFYGCSSLTSINIPEGVTSIGWETFYGCSSLISINIPEGVTSIGGQAFYGCSSLTSINIPEGVTSIGWETFYGCSSLTSINIPEGVTSIEDWAFCGCSSLTSINIPEGMTNIGAYAFIRCSSLTSINIPEGVTSIGDGAFDGCSSLTSINIPEGVTSIGVSAFILCSSLISINIPEGVTSIGNGAFYGCSSLISINIPEGVTRIENSAFDGCSSLTSINIPESVTSIGDWAFDGCSSLRTIKWNTTCSIPDYISLSGKLILYGTKDITSTEGYDITTAKQAIYTKSFYSSYENSWYTISLPFKPTQITHESKGTIVPFDSGIKGAKNFWLRELTTDGYQDVTEMEASHAYIIAMPTSYNYSDEFRLDGTVTFSAEDVTLSWNPVVSEGTTFTMYPTYETVKKAMDVYALNSEYWVNGYDYGRAWVRGSIDVNPYEAYVKLNDGAATMRSVLPMADGKRTAVRGSNDASSRGAYGHQKPRKEDM